MRILNPRIRKELKRRAEGDTRAFAMWKAYIGFLESCPTFEKGAVRTAVHHILWRSEYPRYIKSKWNMIRLSNEDHSAAAALMLAAEPENSKLRGGFYATYKLAGTVKTWKPKNPFKVICLYTEKRWNTPRIAKKYNKVTSVILDFLRRNKIDIRTQGESRIWKPKEPQKVIKMYLNGLSMEKIASRFNCSVTRVNRFLHANNIKMRHTTDYRLWKPSNPDDVIESYKAGKSVSSIGKKYKRSDNSVRVFLLRNGIKSIRSASSYHYWVPPNPKEIIRLYKKGWTQKSIGAKYGVSHAPVAKFLREQGFRNRASGETQHLSWHTNQGTENPDCNFCKQALVV